MTSLMNTVKRIFGGSPTQHETSERNANAGSIASARPADPRKQQLKAQDDFKTAVRDGDIGAIETMLTAKSVSLGDEFTGGRGVLQFAVMTNSLKAVRLLIERGADASKVDSLGASADTLARKSGSANMARALHPS